MNQQSKIPLIIGISGHRRIVGVEPGNECYKLHKEKVRSLLEYWLNALPDTPIWFMSPLAEGADIISAEALIELKQKIEYCERLKLIIPLPFDKEEYLKDFAPENNGSGCSWRGKFHTLIEQSDESFVVRPYGDEDYLKDVPLDDNWNYTPARNHQYLNVGAFVAHYSNILIALWDDTLTGEKGGTQDIVHFMLGEQLPLTDFQPGYLNSLQTPLFAGAEQGVVCHIPVKQVNKNKAVLTPLEKEAQLHRAYCLNSEANKNSPAQVFFGEHPLPEGVHLYGAADVKNAIDEKRPDANINLQDELVSEFCELIDQLECHNKRENQSIPLADTTTNKQSSKRLSENLIDVLGYSSDQWAMDYQKKDKNLRMIFFLSILVLLASYEAFNYYSEDNILWARVSLGSLAFSVVCIIVISVLNNIVRYKQKQQDYRTLAEYLRVKKCMNQLYVSPGGEGILPLIWRKKFAWIKQVGDISELPLWDSKQSNSPKKSEITNVYREFVIGQISYLSKRSSKLNNYHLGEENKADGSVIPLSKSDFRKYELFNLTESVMYFMTLLIVFAVVVSFFSGWFQGWMFFAVGVCLALSGGISVWKSAHTYERNYRSYLSLKQLFKQSAYCFNLVLQKKSNTDPQTEGNEVVLPSDIKLVHGTMQELAKCYMDETIDWYESQSSAKVEDEAVAGLTQWVLKRLKIRFF